MKHIISLMVLLLFSVGVFAQKNNRSTLRIQLSDGSPLTVSINGRYFQKTGRSLTIGDLPRKRHSIKVYRYRPYQDGQGGKAELVYSGRIKVEPGQKYDCYVDLESRQFRMLRVNVLENRQVVATTGTEPQITEDDDIGLPPSQTRSPKLEALKQQVDAKDGDVAKLQVAKNWLAQKKVTTNDIKDIGSWFFFDDTRLEFVKYGYSRVSDPERYKEVGSIFTLDASLKDFEKYMQSK